LVEHGSRHFFPSWLSMPPASISIGGRSGVLIEADNFSGLAGRRIIELENRVAGRLEETVVGFEQLDRLAFQL
jgi:hypothetical protein